MPFWLIFKSMLASAETWGQISYEPKFEIVVALQVINIIKISNII